MPPAGNWLLMQLLCEVLPPSLVIRKGHAEAFDRTIVLTRHERLLRGLGHRLQTSGSQLSREIRSCAIHSNSSTSIAPAGTRLTREFPQGRQRTSATERR